MQKQWKDIKVGDVFRDGSRVTQIHGMHTQPSCKVIYDGTEEFICSYNHILLIDVSKLPEKAKTELETYCTTVPLEESIRVEWIASDNNEPLTPMEMDIVEQFCRNEPISVRVDCFNDDDKMFKDVVYGEVDTNMYYFNFKEATKQVLIMPYVVKEEPQKVDENTYWLNCKGIEYLMKTYNAELYCNGMPINAIIPMGDLPCFCVSTDTGRYET